MIQCRQREDFVHDAQRIRKLHLGNSKVMDFCVETLSRLLGITRGPPREQISIKLLKETDSMKSVHSYCRFSRVCETRDWQVALKYLKWLFLVQLKTYSALTDFRAVRVWSAEMRGTAVAVTFAVFWWWCSWCCGPVVRPMLAPRLSGLQCQSIVTSVFIQTEICYWD